MCGIATVDMLGGWGILGPILRAGKKIVLWFQTFEARARKCSDRISIYVWASSLTHWFNIWAWLWGPNLQTGRNWIDVKQNRAAERVVWLLKLGLRTSPLSVIISNLLRIRSAVCGWPVTNMSNRSNQDGGKWNVRCGFFFFFWVTIQSIALETHHTTCSAPNNKRTQPVTSWWTTCSI